MAESLQGKRIAILATDGFERSELESPRAALTKHGASVHIVSLESGSIRGWKDGDWSGSVSVDRTLDDVDAGDYDALVLPGGVINPDKLRVDERALELVRAFARANKTLAAICHGPWTLIDAGVVKGRRMTSYASIRRDLENAGARWVDEEVAIDGKLITSRSPDDLPAFERAIVRSLGSADVVSATQP
jgi:protease I